MYKYMVARKLLDCEHGNDIQHEEYAVAQCCAKPRPRPAERGHAEPPVHEDVVEHDVDRDRCNRDIHGEVRPPVRINEIAQHNGRCNRNQTA